MSEINPDLTGTIDFEYIFSVTGFGWWTENSNA